MAVPIGMSRNNAIVAAVFVLQFEQPVLDEVRSRMTHDLLLDRDRYPGFSQILIPSPQLGFVMGQVVPSLQQNMSVVPVWRKFHVDGSLVHEIRVEPSSIVFVCHDYSRWNSVLSQAVSDMLRLISAIEENKLSAIVLQVTDAFRLDVGETVFFETLDNQSKYLPSHILGVGDVLWHSHQGWFDADLDGTGDRVLNRLNINVFDAINNQRELHVEHFIEQRPSVSIEYAYVSESVLTQIFNAAHAKNKFLMSNLLHEAMQKKVSLNDDA